MIHLSELKVRDEEHPDGDVVIEVVGLRPGEKLDEELLIGEDVEGTLHSLIMRAYEHELSWGLLQESLTELDLASQSFNCEKVLALLTSLVREYAPALHGDGELLWRMMVEPKSGNVALH